MRIDLSEILACPECYATLRVEATHSVFELQATKHVAQGVLCCSEGHRFPILDEVPRLLCLSQLHCEELRVLSRQPPRQPKTIQPVTVAPSAVEAKIRRRVASSYRLHNSSPTAQWMRASAEIAYLTAEYRGQNKRKYCRVLKRLVPRASTVLDVGGSLPGLASSLRAELGTTCAIVADIDVRFVAAFKTPTRDVMLVRADAQRLPFRTRSFDVAVSAFLLEHVSDWQAAVRSVTRVGRVALIAFGPNRWFPFELGHLNAPLAGTIPKWAAAYVAFAWLKLIRAGRPLDRIRQILAAMTYVSSTAFRRYCIQLGIMPLNLFPMIVHEIASDQVAPTSSMRQIIRRFPRSAKLVAHVLTACGLEPNVYYFLRASHCTPGLPSRVAPQGDCLPEDKDTAGPVQ